MAPVEKRRLDEILVAEGLISQAQIDDALTRQKMHGGKFGSQLLYHRYIDEASLVKALTIQFGCEGVVLSEIDIPEAVARMVPSKLALTRMVMPFEYDPKTATLKVACENPTDPALLNELNFIAQGKKIKLYVAAELVLETVINKHFLGRDADLNDRLLVEIPDDLTAGATTRDAANSGPVETSQQPSKAILFVSDEEYATSLLESVLCREGYEVTVADSLEKAREMAGGGFCAVFIREAMEGDRDPLVEALRRGSPRATVQVFKSAAALVLHHEAFEVAEEILIRNLGLLTSLLSSKSNLPHNHSAIVGRYAEKLSRRLGLSARDRMHVVMAAYLHDLARFYYPGPAVGDRADRHASDSGEYKAIIESSRKLLASFEYSGPIVGMLSAMYRDLKESNHSSASLEALGGNIVTIVDLFCENLEVNRAFTLEKFDAVKKRLRDFTGKLFFPEVVEVFIGLIQEEILNIHTAARGRVHLFAGNPRASYPLALRLQNEGFEVVACENVDALTTATADAVVLHLGMEPERIAAFIDDLGGRGFDFKVTPTVLIVPHADIAKLGWLYERGVEDVLSDELGIDTMILKLRRLSGRMQKPAGSPGDGQPGAKGRLADMNLIDLMQALAPGRRTVKIAVTPAGDAIDKLVVFLDKGTIAFAQLGGLTGAEAVYTGMTWTDGAWTVEPVPPESLPPANNTASNDAILMEGAYRLDEKMRAGKL